MSSAPCPTPPDFGPLEDLLHQATPSPLPPELLQRLRQAGPASSSAAAPAPVPGPLPAARNLLRFPSAWRAAAAALAVGAAGMALLSQRGKPGHRQAGTAAPPVEPLTAAGPSVPPPSGSGGAAASGSPAGLPEVAFSPSLESRQHLLRVRDLGVIQDSRQRPVRLMSTTWLDENTYGMPGARPDIEESRLRHEIVPVVLPTY